MFPFHTWLPDAHTDAPTAGSVILAAVLLKMGTYGFLRFSLPILPEATRAFVPMMVAALDHRHRLRRARRAGAEGLEAAGRVLVGQPHGDGDARHVRAEPGRHHRQHRPAAQSRHLDRRALPPRRHRLRAAPHARDLRVRRPVEGDAGLRRGLPDHDDVVDRAADAERLHRRVPDPAGRVRGEQDVGGVRRQRRRARRGLHAVSLSADDVRQGRESEERAAARPEPPRVRDVRAAAGSRGLDRPLSDAVPRSARDVGAARHRAREPAVQPATLRERDPTAATHRRQPRSSTNGAAPIPRVRPVRAGRQAARAGARRAPRSTR